MIDIFLLGLTFMMGVLSLVSPCVLPVIPSYLAYLFGRNKTGIIIGSLSIYGGILLGVGCVGLTVSAIGPVTGTRVFYLAASIIVFVMIIDALGASLLRQLNFNIFREKKGMVTGFTFGLLLMLVAAPCTIPLFVTTTIIAATLSEGFSRFVLLLAYALGLGLPLVVMGIIPDFSSRLKNISGKWLSWTKVLILFGTLIWLLWMFLVSYP
ncbi:MAG: cytochrome c biogenesis CcdA family protein [Candidatus Methanomethylicaceae archaeon]